MWLVNRFTRRRRQQKRFFFLFKVEINSEKIAKKKVMMARLWQNENAHVSIIVFAAAHKHSTRVPDARSPRAFLYARPAPAGTESPPDLPPSDLSPTQSNHCKTCAMACSVLSVHLHAVAVCASVYLRARLATCVPPTKCDRERMCRQTALISSFILPINFVYVTREYTELVCVFVLVDCAHFHNTTVLFFRFWSMLGIFQVSQAANVLLSSSSSFSILWLLASSQWDTCVYRHISLIVRYRHDGAKLLFAYRRHNEIVRRIATTKQCLAQVAWRLNSFRA